MPTPTLDPVVRADRLLTELHGHVAEAPPGPLTRMAEISAELERLATDADGADAGLVLALVARAGEGHLLVARGLEDRGPADPAYLVPRARPARDRAAALLEHAVTLVGDVGAASDDDARRAWGLYVAAWDPRPPPGEGPPGVDGWLASPRCLLEARVDRPLGVAIREGASRLREVLPALPACVPTELRDHGAAALREAERVLSEGDRAAGYEARDGVDAWWTELELGWSGWCPGVAPARRPDRRLDGAPAPAVPPLDASLAPLDAWRRSLQRPDGEACAAEPYDLAAWTERVRTRLAPVDVALEPVDRARAWHDAARDLLAVEPPCMTPPAREGDLHRWLAALAWEAQAREQEALDLVLAPGRARSWPDPVRRAASDQWDRLTELRVHTRAWAESFPSTPANVCG